MGFSMIILLAVLLVFGVVVVAGVVGLIALGRATGSVWLPLGIVAVPIVLLVMVGFFLVGETRVSRGPMVSSTRPVPMFVKTPDEQEMTGTLTKYGTDEADSIGPASSDVARIHERPEWVDTAESRVGDRIRVTIAAGPYTQLTACDRELNERLIEVAQDHVEATLGDKMTSPLDVSPTWLRANIVIDEYHEVTQHAFGPGAEQQSMYHAYMLVDFDDVADRFLIQHARQATVGHRLIVGSFLVVGLLVVLTTVFGYLKTDQATEQKYTGRLKFAAGSVILATIAAGAALVLIA